MIKNCKQCKKNFKTDRKKAKYCSSECYGVSMMKEAPKHTCDECGDKFRRHNSSLKGKNKFCSMKCSAKFTRRALKKKETKTINCAYCKKDFVAEVIPSKTRTFCSITCANRGKVKSPTLAILNKR